jgi:transposase InsO family protein
MEFPVGKMCHVLEVSKSGYYQWLHRQSGKRAMFNQQLMLEIKQVYTKSKCRYGSPRIAKELQMLGIKASTPLVARLMKKENIRSIIKKRFKQTTDSKHHYPVAENKLMHQFTVREKNEAWVSDLTYIRT